MTDGSPLVSIRKSLARVKAEIVGMDVRVRIQMVEMPIFEQVMKNSSLYRFRAKKNYCSKGGSVRALVATSPPQRSPPHAERSSGCCSLNLHRSFLRQKNIVMIISTLKYNTTTFSSI